MFTLIPKNKKGFTLVEMLVAIALFTIVMTIAAGAIFSIVNANRQAQSLNAVITNLDFTVESMLREMRTGYNYACGATIDGDGPPTVVDCPNGGTSIAFINAQGYQVAYAYNIVNGVGSITRDITVGPSAGIPVAETAPEVNIQKLEFYVYGTGAGTQPRVLVQIMGTAGTGKNQSTFDIQTFVSQRALNQ